MHCLASGTWNYFFSLISVRIPLLLATDLGTHESSANPKKVMKVDGGEFS